MFEQILSSLDGLTDLERTDVLRVLMSKDNRLSKVNRQGLLFFLFPP